MQSGVVMVGRINSAATVKLLGTAFLLNSTGKFATAAHVTGGNDTDLVITWRDFEWNSYQDTGDPSLSVIGARIHQMDPFNDVCILQTDFSGASHINLSGTDAVMPGQTVFLYGYPHCDYGRIVQTYQQTVIGAKILVATHSIKSKYVTLNIQARPGQSGSPILTSKEHVIAMLIGSYAPGGGGRVSVGGVDPATLHQTTHAVSSEYISRMV